MTPTEPGKDPDNVPGSTPGNDPTRVLELSSAELRRLVGLAVERIVAHLDSLPEQPAGPGPNQDEELALSVAEGMPEEGSAAEPLLDLLFERLVPASFNTAGPGYLAYVPGGGLLHAAVADLISNATNRYTGVWLAAPGLVQLEVNVLAWFSRMLGFPPEARGFLTTGGSLANLSGITTARLERLPENFLDGVIYTSEQVHHSVAKAARLAGFPARRVRALPTDERFRLRSETVERAVEEDRAAGLEPFLVVASAGTTNTGAVDDLEGLAELAAREGLWLHVDAAYGGFFALTERGKRALAGIERADSAALDPHKGLFLPYGTGCLLVRDGAALKRAHSIEAHYMPSLQDSLDRVDFCEISPELSRDFRGLRVWLPFKMHGAVAFRAALDEKLDLALWVAEELRRIEHVEIVAEPQLSLLAFRLAPPGRGAEDLDALNRRWLERTNARRRVFLTGTLLDTGTPSGGAFVLRICVLSFRTHRERMEQGLEDLRAAAEVLGE